MWLIDYIKSFFTAEEVIEEELEGMTSEEKRDYKKNERERKIRERREWRIEKINALKEKIYAVAAKRKWLFFIIAAAIVGYLVISYTGFLPKTGNIFKGFF